MGGVYSLLSSNQVMAAVRAIAWHGVSTEGGPADYLAADFLPGGLRLLLSNERLRALAAERFRRRLPGGLAYIAAKSNAIDDLVQRSMAEQGHKQVLIIGAGLDSRAYRLNALRHRAAVYEIDRCDVVFAKEKQVRRLGLAHRHVTWLSKEIGTCSRVMGIDWLRARGIKREQRTLFLLDGLTYLLSPSALDALLTVIGQFASGSEVVFDFAYAEMLAGKLYPGSKEFCATLAATDEPVRSSICEHGLPEFLRQYGLVPVSRLAPAALVADYLTDSKGQDTSPYGFLEIVRARVQRELKVGCRQV